MTQTQTIWDFIDQHPELNEDQLLDELEKHFSRAEIDEFTQAMTGFTSPQETPTETGQQIPKSRA